MPSATSAAAVLAVADMVWEFEAWQERTKHVTLPYDKNATPSRTSLSLEELAAVRALAARIHAYPSFRKRVNEYLAKDDNDTLGKAAWNKWFLKVNGGWNMKKDMELSLDMHERHPRLLIGTIGGAPYDIPMMKHAQLGVVEEDVLVKFFGEDAYVDPTSQYRLLRPTLLEFIRTLFANLWQRVRNSARNQYKKLEDGKMEVAFEYEKLSKVDSNQNLTVDDLLPFLRKVDRLMVLAAAFNDKVGSEALEKPLEDIADMYKIVTGELAPHKVKGLSKNLRDALGRMASKREAITMGEQLVERMEVEKAHMVDQMEFDVDDPPTFEEWSEGVEHLKEKTPAQLYEWLGLDTHSIPFFKVQASVEGGVSGDLGELETSATTTEGTLLRWHQLVGVVRILERAIKSEPVLLMDDVGLGKTVEVIALFAMLAYYREYFRTWQRYPGKWGKSDGWRNYAGEVRELPELPFLMVVPPTLVEQVALECTRFLQAGSFDVIKVTGATDMHADLWREADSRSSLPSHMRIYVAATTAVQSDAGRIYTLRGRGKPVRQPLAGRDEHKTVFGRRYLAIAVDKAHAFRNVNKLYGAVRALREQTDVFVAMTATPVQTRATDLWNIGKAIGLLGFDDRYDHELDAMNKALAKAKREDRNQMKAMDEDEFNEKVVAFVAGEGEEEGVHVHTNFVSAQYMRMIREKYEGAVIRRTAYSVDYRGYSITGLEPYDEHKILVQLNEHEYEALERLAETAVDSETFVRHFASENFYLDIRKTLLHPWCVVSKEKGASKETIEKIQTKTYAEYLAEPSGKLDRLVTILQHHLAEDGALGWTEGEVSEPSEPRQPPPREQQVRPLDPDKIIVYSYFPSSFWLIKLVLESNGINLVTMHGGMSQKKRVDVLNSFRYCDRNGARVLLISNVGSVGLNIACANILIIVDVLWSVLSEQQLIGRVWRFPQQKKVHIYRLIGARSPDIFLNNISYGKGSIQDMFSNIGDKLSQVLRLGEEEPMDDIEGGCKDDMESTDEDDAVSASGRKGKDKGKGKDKSKGKGKPKGKEKTSEPKPKQKKKAATRVRGGKGKTKEAGEAEPEPRLEHVPDEATPSVEAGPSKFAEGDEFGPTSSPEDSSGLPRSIAELERVVPQFVGEDYGIMDELDEEEDAELAVLKVSHRPDMTHYIDLELSRSNLQFKALTRTQTGESDARDQLGKRASALMGLLAAYRNQTQASANYAEQENPSLTVSESVDNDDDVSMPVADEAGEEGWPSTGSSPPTNPSDWPESQMGDPEGSEFGLDQTPSATTSSKRSREPSDDSDDIEVSGVQVWKGKAKAKAKSEAKKSKRPKESETAGKSARRSAYKRVNLSEQPTQALDLELLHARSAGSSKSRKGRSATAQALALDDDTTTQSFQAMQLNWDKTDSGSSQPSSRHGQASSRGSSRGRRDR